MILYHNIYEGALFIGHKQTVWPQMLCGITLDTPKNESRLV